MTLKTDTDLAFAEALEQQGVASSSHAGTADNVIAFSAELATDDSRAAFLNAAADRNFFDVQHFCESMRPPEAIIDGLLYANGVGVIYGQAGIGKSYFTTDLALSLASDMESFHGRPLRLQGARVAMLLYEGEYAIPRRVKAWQKAHRRDIPADRLLIRYDLAPLHDAKATTRLAQDLKDLNVDIVIIDTLSAATAGLDEDKARDMGPVISMCRKMAREINGLCLLVAHPPKGSTSTVRGSSVIDGNTDNLLAITGENGGISIKPRKVRAGAPAKPMKLKFKQIDIGEDPEHPDRRLSESYLAQAGTATGFERCLIDLLDQSSSVSKADLVNELVERDVCKKSTAYNLIKQHIPEGERTSIGVYDVVHTKGTITIQEEPI